MGGIRPAVVGLLLLAVLSLSVLSCIVEDYCSVNVMNKTSTHLSWKPFLNQVAEGKNAKCLIPVQQVIYEGLRMRSLIGRGGSFEVKLTFLL